MASLRGRSPLHLGNARGRTDHSLFARHRDAAGPYLPDVRPRISLDAGRRVSLRGTEAHNAGAGRERLGVRKRLPKRKKGIAFEATGAMWDEGVGIPSLPQGGKHWATACLCVVLCGAGSLLSGPPRSAASWCESWEPPS